MDINYERIPQNDKVAIQYVKDDYESQPAKGLTHGLQKDVIQNSIGAAIKFKSLKNWSVKFELIKIKDKDALIFVDEGTTGLTGEILDSDEISERSANNNLRDPNSTYQDFYHCESGGNVGPGSYGRGKLVFQACSESYTILCDSLRTDNKYVAFKQTIKNNHFISLKFSLIQMLSPLLRKNHTIHYYLSKILGCGLQFLILIRLNNLMVFLSRKHFLSLLIQRLMIQIVR